MADLHEQYLFDDQDAGRSIAQVHDKTEENEILLTMPAERVSRLKLYKAARRDADSRTEHHSRTDLYFESHHSKARLG